VDRAPGLSVRLKLTLSYAGFLMLAGLLMLAAAWFAGRPGQSSDLLLRVVPDDALDAADDTDRGDTAGADRHDEPHRPIRPLRCRLREG